jgi:outer membrane protein OmpA-like peptidoglycan-associated protein
MPVRSTARPAIALVALAQLTALAGCATVKQALDTDKERGAAIGVTAGAVAGGLIGRANGSTAKGAILGAVVGGAAGAIIGHQMDQRAKTLQQNIPNARVERVGEGILVTFASGLLYDFNSDAVKPTAQDNLRTLAENLNKYPDTRLLVVGHTDSVGTDAYNQQLSLRRAQAAAAYLEAQGVPAARVQVEGKGEAEPVAPNATDAGRAQNRRVEVAIYADDALKARARQEAQQGASGGA